MPYGGPFPVADVAAALLPAGPLRETSIEDARQRCWLLWSVDPGRAPGGYPRVTLRIAPADSGFATGFAERVAFWRTVERAVVGEHAAGGGGPLVRVGDTHAELLVRRGDEVLLLQAGYLPGVTDHGPAAASLAEAVLARWPEPTAAAAAPPPTRRFRASYFQYALRTGWPEEFVDPDEQPGGVFAQTPDREWAVVRMGAHSAEIALTTGALAAAPAEVDRDWDVVSETSLLVPDGTELFLDPYGGGQEPADLARGTGWYRVRGHVRGRDAAWITGDDTITTSEEHLLLAWPAPPAPPTVLHGPDAAGRHWQPQ